MRPAGDARVPPASAGDPAVGQQAGAGLPRPASIWDLPERGARGPRPRHNRAVIAATAARIADAQGLDAVTMRRVASELGMATMSLYNYVPAKGHLAQLVIDHLAAGYAYASLPAPTRARPSRTWPGRPATSPGATRGCPGCCTARCRPALTGCATWITSSACWPAPGSIPGRSWKSLP